MNSLLALMLAFTLIFGQSGVVYAAEPADVPVNEEGSVAEVQPEDEETPVVSEDKISTDTEDNEVLPETPEEGNTESEDENKESVEFPEEGNDSENEDKTEEPVENEDEQGENPDESDGINEDETSDNQEQTVEEDENDDSIMNSTLSIDKQKQLNALGFKTKSLSREMKAEKSALMPVVQDLASMTPDKDYIENEIVYLADSEEEAIETAECYGGTLSEYEYGVAVAVIERTVSEAVTVAADMEIPIPAVYPNAIYSVSSATDAVAEETGKALLVEEETSEPDEEDIVWNGEKPYAVAPTDPGYTSQWYHENVHTAEAWDATEGEGVTVAVLDTGVDTDHPDLKGNIVGAISMIGEDGKDKNGHGTHCAGIVAALKNDIGGVGVAPKAKIYSIQVLGENGSGSIAASIQGVIAATEANVDVISMSLGGIFHIPLFQDAINDAVKKGIVVVAASGNEYTYQKSYPAAYDNVIAVAAAEQKGATEENAVITDFSNLGKWVDVVAPGENIYSTLPTYPAYDTAGMTNYGSLDGTSMACPVVAGTVALMLSNGKPTKDKNLSNNITKTLLNSTSARAWEYYEDYEYWGDSYPYIDIEAATYAVENTVPATPEIHFSAGEPSVKNVILGGYDQTFTFTTSTPHSKIFYTINGKKPTAKTGSRMYKGMGRRMTRSGKVKIQAVAVLGGKTSKVFSKTYTFDVKATNLLPECDENMTVGIGKSIQLNVGIEPSYVSNKKLEWTSSDPDKMIKVSKTGKVTCNKKAEEGRKATITAKTQDGTDLQYIFTVEAVKDMAEKLTLDAPTLKMSYWADYSEVNMAGYEEEHQLKPVVQGKDTTQYLYKSSNTKVATVTSDGLVMARGKGKATITVTANDGSGKKATCKVTVVTPILDIYSYSSTGYSTDGEIPIGTGCSIKMNTTVNGNSKSLLLAPSNKKLDWVSENTSAIKASNGKITCAKNATPGTKVKVTAKAKDGFGADLEMTFVVKAKIEKLYTYSDIPGDTNEYVGINFNNPKDPIVVGEMVPDEAISGLFKVRAKANGKESAEYTNEFTLSISNRDVIYHYYHIDEERPFYGYVFAFTKAGNCTVTFTARDGSNKKFVMKFTVKNPV